MSCSEQSKTYGLVWRRQAGLDHLGDALDLAGQHQLPCIARWIDDDHLHLRITTSVRLAPYLRTVKARIARNPDNVAWVTLDERWRALVDHANAVVSKFRSGKAGVRWELLAAREVVKLAGDVQPRDVVEVLAYCSRDATSPPVIGFAACRGNDAAADY